MTIVDEFTRPSTSDQHESHRILNTFIVWSQICGWLVVEPYPVVYLPLWKIWVSQVSQMGWLFPTEWKVIIHSCSRWFSIAMLVYQGVFPMVFPIYGGFSHGLLPTPMKPGFLGAICHGNGTNPTPVTAGMQQHMLHSLSRFAPVQSAGVVETVVSKWSYHSVVEPWLIMKLCGKHWYAINLYKPTIWGWLKSKPFMMILGMVYGIGFTTCSYEIVYNWDSTSLHWWIYGYLAIIHGGYRISNLGYAFFYRNS